MGRKRRICGRRITYHIVTRCVQRRFLFSPESFPLVLATLRQAKQKYGFQCYGFTLMHNHYHLILQTRQASIATVMKYINQQIAWKVNRLLGSRGHFWEKRYSDSIIEANRYLLEVLAYIHLNPVRAGLVQKAEDYPWSSYHAYILDEASDLVDFPDVYLQCSKMPDRRRRIMRELTEHKPDTPGHPSLQQRRLEMSERIFYGSPAFLEQMQREHAASLTPLRKARQRVLRNTLAGPAVSGNTHGIATARVLKNEET